MAYRFQISSLVPTGLAVERVTYTDDAIVVTARAEARSPLVRYAELHRGAFTAAISGRCRICPVQVRGSTFASSRAVSSAGRPIVGGGSSPSASATPCLRSGHGGRRGWSASSIISGWLWAADRRQASPGG